jgi:NitT/TauT family transport system substrate-binding protein
MRGIRWMVLIAVALLATALAGSASAETLRFGLSAGINTAVQPALYAKSAGLFAAAGLDVRFVDLNDDPTAVQALIANEFDMLYVGAGPGIVAISRGADIRLVSSFTPLSDSIFIARDEVKTLKDMEGRILAVAKVGSLSYITTLAAMRLEGVDISKVQIIAAGNDAAKAQMVAAGRVQGTTLNGIGAAPILKPGSGLHVIYDVGAALHDSLLNTAVFARGAFIRDHPEAVQGAVKALIQASRALQSDHKLAVTNAISTGLPADMIQPTYDHLFSLGMNYYGVDGGVRPPIVAATIKLLKDNGELDTSPEVAQVIDLRFMDAALAELGPYKP